MFVFYSKGLKLRDTGLIIVGYLPAILGFLGEAFFSQVTPTVGVDPKEYRLCLRRYRLF